MTTPVTVIPRRIGLMTMKFRRQQISMRLKRRGEGGRGKKSISKMNGMIKSRAFGQW